MPKYYLRLEGVNLSNFVYDTEDLSTVRGGGLRLLDAIEEIKNEFRKYLVPISTGASSGLFEVKVSSLEKAQNVKDKIANCLNSDSCLKHATFVIDVLESKNINFKEDREQLLAMNRWSQMQSPSVAVPAQSSDSPCAIDMVRPAGSNKLPKYKDQKDVHVSDSVYYRKDYGLEAKQAFYKKITGIDDLPEFVKELDELTSDESKGNLHHKMAVIYIDGNSFGDIQKDTKNQSELKNWDDTIKDYRKQMLSKLLTETIRKPEWSNKNNHRMETLLWGGDELIWVVPAWKGWETLMFFYQQSIGWKYTNTKQEESPLTHAGGMVFCHHNAPIYRIKNLVEKLAKSAKDKSKSKSLFAYQILESFDHISHDFDNIRNRLATDGKSASLILDGNDMKEIQKNINDLKENEFPKNKLHTIIKRLRSGNDSGDVIKKTIKGLPGDVKTNLLKLTEVCNGDNSKWGHIADLWDYLV